MLAALGPANRLDGDIALLEAPEDVRRYRAEYLAQARAQLRHT